MVDVWVGPEEVFGELSKALLSQVSECFRRYLNGLFQEGAKLVAVLDEEDPEVFCRYVRK